MAVVPFRPDPGPKNDLISSEIIRGILWMKPNASPPTFISKVWHGSVGVIMS